MSTNPSVTVTAPINIALLKYWGKRDVALNLPTNDSLSITLDPAQLCTTTTATLTSLPTTPDPSDPPNGPPPIQFYLNNAPQHPIPGRMQTVIGLLRAQRTTMETLDPTLPHLAHAPLEIRSSNNFPTAAGLASSASGYAALVHALVHLFHLPLDPVQQSLFARQGSGSAARSLASGFVHWRAGVDPAGQDSVAVQLASAPHWPLHALICVVDDRPKAVSSAEGMQRTAATSALFPFRLSHVVPRRLDALKNAIANKDFDALAQETMADSNSFHATCQDSFPPIAYLSQTSHAIIHLVHAINARAAAKGQSTVLAYTFDAGPNAVLLLEPHNLPYVLQILLALFPPITPFQSALLGPASVPEPNPHAFDADAGPGTLARIIHTQVGDGPRLLS